MAFRRFGQRIRVKPEAIDEYERLHAAAWPGVLAQIHRSNIRNYTIWRDGEEWRAIAGEVAAAAASSAAAGAAR